MNKIVIFTGNANYAVTKSIASLLVDRPTLAVLVIIQCPRRTLGSLLKSQKLNLRRHGWRWIPYQCRELLKRLNSDRPPIKGGAVRRPGDSYRMPALESDERVQFVTVDDMHCEEALEHTKQFGPDLGISLAAPILRPTLFTIPRLGTINLHKGALPGYRGMPPAFWELWNDEREIGCSVHYIDDGLDTGDILLDGKIYRSEFSTERGLRLQLDELGVKLVTDCIALLENDTVKPRPQPKGGTTNRRPTLKQEALLRKKLTRTSTDSRLRATVKSMAAIAYTKLLRPCLRFANFVSGNREVVVLLYHRVSDEFRDAVTVGIEQFDEQMRYISMHYTVVDIPAIVNGDLPSTNWGKPIVAVTFDDGYLDNYENAVPILQRHGIPAGFFVSTGMISSKNGFDHDLRKIGRALPNMTWENLIEMHKDGFTIGSHTVTHVNCANIPEAELLEQLLVSKGDLQRNCGLQDVYFAYPFGGRKDMSAEAMIHVKSSGYRACLSAYGGVNRGTIDPFNILRTGVSANFEFRRFVARIEGW